MARTLVITSLIVASCGAPDRASGSLFGGSDDGELATTAVGAEEGEHPADSGATGSADDSAPNPDGPKLDVGAAEGGPGPCVEGDSCLGCTAVDILFVIDNSGSMCTYQENLAAAFPGFADAMWDQLPPGTDLHVGITTSSFCNPGADPGHSENTCEMGESQAVALQNYILPTEATVGGNGWQGRLLEHDGKTFFAANTADADARDDLSAWFSQAATSVGCNGCGFDFAPAAAAYALHPSNAAHNEGFLRDSGAVLLLFILSDEGSPSPEPNSTYHDIVVGQKAGCGGDTCVVSGGVLSEICILNNKNASFNFLASFGEDPVWSTIGFPGFPGPPPDYEATVGAALAQVVAQTCETIPPAG